MNVKIEELLPHRPPFLFVDKIISATQEEVIAVKVFDDANEWLKNSFPNHQYVPGTLLIESMAQSGGAAIRFLGIAKDIFVLSVIERVEFMKEVEYGKQLRYVIKNIKISEKLIKQSGIAYLDEQQVMKATWMSVKAPAK